MSAHGLASPEEIKESNKNDARIIEKVWSGETSTQASAQMTKYEKQKIKMEVFKKLHYTNILLLPNAWDAISAKLFEVNGAQAIGITSAGIAASLGYQDGEHMPKNVFLSAVERIISSVHIPVSVDVEAGYGKTINEICDTVEQIINMGAVGINLEDTDPKTSQLIAVSEQVNRISAIRNLAIKNNLPLFINARTDVYWSSNIEQKQRYAEALGRLLAYKKAGADGLFVPGLTQNDIKIMTSFHKEAQLPLNILGASWITSVDLLKNAGIARISIGSGIFRGAATYTQKAYNQFKQGDFSFLKNCISYDTINDLYK